MTFAGYLAEIRALDLPGVPTLSGQTRAMVQLQNEFAEARHKRDAGWPELVGGGGQTFVRVRVQAVDPGTSDPVLAEVRARAWDRTHAQFTIVLANGEQLNGAFAVEGLTDEADEADVARIDFTLRASGPVLRAP